jgi:hypothetical protein
VRRNPDYVAPENLTWPEMDDLFGEHVDHYRKINSGIHVALLGTTRGGKTTLATGGQSEPGHGLLAHFEDVLVIDSTGDPGSIHDYGIPVARFGAIRGHRRLSVSRNSPKTRELIYKYMNRAVGQKGVAIYCDEVRQLAEKKFFNLGETMEHIWLFCAKQGTSLIGGSQAPRWLPGAFYDQSKSSFIFGMQDRRARKRLAEIGGDTDTLEIVIPTLSMQNYEFANVGIDGIVRTSRYELPKKNASPSAGNSERMPVTDSGLTVVRG